MATALEAALLARLTHFSLPIHPDGRKATISDGFHERGDMRYRNGVGHRGFDAMWRKRLASPPDHPWSSKWYEAQKGRRVPVLARGPGRVVIAELLSTGGWVVLDHGMGVGTAQHHLAELLVVPGQLVVAGQPVGIMGGSPIGYGLVHDHDDTAIGCAFDVKRMRKYQRIDGTCIDPAPFMTKAIHITESEAWDLHQAVLEGPHRLHGAAEPAIAGVGALLRRIAGIFG